MSEARRGQPQSKLQPAHPPNGFRAVTLRPAVLGLAKLAFIPLVSAAPLLTARSHDHGDDDGMSSEDPDLWIYLSIAVALVLLGGAFAGLTIALMGQDETYLQVIASSGEGKERKNAQTVLDLLGKGKHWVLVTLLLSNVITNETLPIVLDRSLGGGWPAVVSSTVLIGMCSGLWRDHTDSFSYLWRDRPSVDLCSIWLVNWCLDGTSRACIDVANVHRCMADGKAARLSPWRRSRHFIQQAWPEDPGAASQDTRYDTIRSTNRR